MAGIRKSAGVGLATLIASALLAAPASGAQLLDTTLSIDRAVDRSCLTGAAAGGDGYAQRSVTAPDTGWLTARLRAASGDWDVGVFDAGSGQRLSGGASPGASELAQVFVTAGQRLTLQACRLSGAATHGRLAVESTAVKRDPSFEPSLVIVSTPTRARKNELLSLGLDVTEHGGPGFLAVVLRGERDARALRKANFVYKTVVRDLARQNIRDRRAEARYARSVQASSLPSERDTYRNLEDYENEMKDLAQKNPGLVKTLTLPFKTWTGRTVQGIEITTDENAADGKPVFLQMGVHHAREWPSGEHAMEWAHELVKGYNSGDARTRRLVESTRTIVVPIINPDGFVTSRQAGVAAGAADGREGVETANLAIPYEFHRKNCRETNPSGEDPASGDCTQQPATGLVQFGTDPNRNYGGFWGGPGASAPGGDPPGDYNQDYRGNGPFSEPETQNVRHLVSTRQVTTLITNHTASNLVLRPPGVQSMGETPDENKGYRSLGDAMAAENGYSSQFGYQLYDTTGTTEDWTYWATGGFGYTFEIGCEAKNEETQECEDFYFHPSFPKVVAEYEGTTTEADENGRDGLGNREAYFKAQENTADASKHSVIGGRAQGGALLRLKKTFDTPTSRIIDREGREGERQFFGDTLETVLEVPGSNEFEWHINPSTRPLHEEQRGRQPLGPASDPVTFSGTPGPSALPCGDFETENDLCFNDHGFTVPDEPGKDNARATVRVEWSTPGSDWDMKLFVDSNGDGSSVGETEEVGSSAQFATNFEQVTVAEPVLAPGKKFVARVVNFTGGEPYEGTVTFQEPDFFEKRLESWKLTCESFSGTVLTSQDLAISRGERKDPGLQACIAAFQRAFATGRGCDRPTRKVYRKGLDRARLGRNRLRHLRSYKIGLKGRRGLDKFCLSDRSAVRIGYPSTRVLRRLKQSERRGLGASKAGLVLASSKRFKVRRVRVGTRAGVMRSRIGRRIRGIRVGKNVWYVKRGAKARLLFKVRRGRVREVGQASLKLTSNRRRAARLLRSFRLG